MAKTFAREGARVFLAGRTVVILDAPMGDGQQAARCTGTGSGTSSRLVDYRRQLEDLLAKDRRGNIVTLFMTEAAGCPPPTRSCTTPS